jgi:hypothetical protein
MLIRIALFVMVCLNVFAKLDGQAIIVISNLVLNNALMVRAKL